MWCDLVRITRDTLDMRDSTYANVANTRLSLAKEYGKVWTNISIAEFIDMPITDFIGYTDRFLAR